MDERLRQLAEDRYRQREFLACLLELAVEGQWFDVQHMVQHDMAKAIIADYSYELGLDYLNQELFFKYFEDVIDVGWRAFSEHTGLPIEKVKVELKQLREAI